MPTTYTHYSFGKEVFCRLPKELQKEVYPYLDAFNIGVHGPDILFYYRSFSKNKVNQYGVQTHKKTMNEFLTHAFSVYKRQRDKKRAFAYLAGVMTHFYLDGYCHPYIKKRIKQTGISHTEIETEFDALMMITNYEDPISKKPASHIRPSSENVRVIAPYFNQKPGVVGEALKEMCFILNHIFRSPLGLKRELVSFANDHIFKKTHCKHYFVMLDWNPENRDTLKQLTSMYHGLIEPCAKEIEELHHALNTFDESYMEKKVFTRNFAG